MNLLLNCGFNFIRCHQRRLFQSSSRSLNLPNPLEHHDYFQIRNLPTIEDLYKSRVHFGHQIGSRHEHMKPYIYGQRMETDIIDLNQTLTHMQNALNFLAHMSYRRAVILFIMQSSIFGHDVEKAAHECGEYSHTRKWPSNAFTDQERSKRVHHFPDVCIFLSTTAGSYEQHPAISECAKMGIATVGIVDTNVNPSLITYPVPGNDDTHQSIHYYLHLFQRAITVGKLTRQIDDMKAEDLIESEKKKSFEQK